MKTHTIVSTKQFFKALAGFALLGWLPCLPAWAGDAATVVFVTGKVESANKSLKLNQVITEGSEISTGADGYIYLKTVDDGLLILRPNSKAKIVTYQVDTVNPKNTQIKFELLSGVARSVTGNAAQLAKENFRFNTPVAAIGIRGTDFVVHTDQETTRIAVLSGGVVASSFGADCNPNGLGPCNTSNSVELFARQVGQLLQLSKGQLKPSLVPNTSVTAPDTVTPPRTDEPQPKAPVSTSSAPSGNTSSAPVTAITNPTNVTTGAATGDLGLDKKKTENIKTDVVAFKDELIAKQVIWGRWRELAEHPATIDINKLRNEGIREAAQNSYYSVFIAGSDKPLPTSGTVAFTYKDGESFIHDEANKVFTAAKIENGSFVVNFAQAKFSTGFDLVSKDERFRLQTTGTLGSDGKLYGTPSYIPYSGSNMVVSGGINEKAAAYVFESRLDPTRFAVGVTNWSK